jgi:Immunoglobulin domain
MLLAPAARCNADSMKPWAKARLAVAALGMSLVLVACGGGGDGGASTGGGSGTSATAPVISSQPQAQNITTGSTATFTVAATGTTPLSYQWSKSGTAIAGATGASYTTPAAALTDSGASFTVSVSNAAGQVASSAAALTVLDAATITAQPQAQTVTTGDTATFSVTATGSALSYQWSKNGTAIAGATGAGYTTPAVTLADTGATFSVAVSNAASKATSTNATLSANADPEGLYLGTVHYTVAGTTLPIFAIVLKDGTAAVFVTEKVLPLNAPVGSSLHGLSIKPTGAGFSSPFIAYRQSGYLFTNGQSTVNGTLSGTIIPGTSISGTFASDVDNGAFQLTAMTSDYNRPASLATLAGTYAYDSAYYVQPSGPETTFHSVTTTDSAGNAGGATTSLGCTSNGATNVIPNPLHNVYTTAVTFTCPAPNPQATLSFTAMSAFFPAGTGAGIVGPAPFASDTQVIITDDTTEQVAFMIVSAKQ